MSVHEYLLALSCAHTSKVEDDSHNKQLHTSKDICNFGGSRLTGRGCNTSDDGNSGKQRVLSVACSCICLHKLLELQFLML